MIQGIPKKNIFKFPGIKIHFNQRIRRPGADQRLVCNGINECQRNILTIYTGKSLEVYFLS